MFKRFDVGAIYVVIHRLTRYFFEVVSRTAKTVTLNLRGEQENFSEFDPVQII